MSLSAHCEYAIVRMKKSNVRHKKFWNSEYEKREGCNFAISTKPSGDLVKFSRWLLRYGDKHGEQSALRHGGFVCDLGCGNGRNTLYLAREFGMSGIGFDISDTAIEIARKNGSGFNLKYEAISVNGYIDLEDNSVDLVLDMMFSHFLNLEDRRKLRSEIYRILKPGGWLFYKTFLLDGDLHARRLLKRYPSDEIGTYVHPKMGVEEHVSSLNEIIREYGDLFEIHKIIKSYKHIGKRGGEKRRSVSVYCRKA